MLKKRVIPILLWKGAGLVKGVGFNSWRRIGSVLPAVKVYNSRSVDELILLDISATSMGVIPNYTAISQIASYCFVPLTVGGGIQSLDHIRSLLRSGADKIAINSAAYENPQLIADASQYFGSQCFVVSIDVKNIDGNYICFSHSGKKDTGIDVMTWAIEMEKLGAGELLITSIDRDGTMLGYDVELIRLVSKSVSIPVIAAGGAGQSEDFYDAIAEGDVSAVAAASIFHFTEYTPRLVKQYLREKGILVRGMLN